MSWYSAAIFSMINEYFVKEFDEYIKLNPPTDAYKSNTIQHVASMPTKQLDLTEISQNSGEQPLIQQHTTDHHHSHINTIIKHLVFLDNSRCCLIDEYVVEIFLKNSVCLPIKWQTTKHLSP